MSNPMAAMQEEIHQKALGSILCILYGLQLPIEAEEIALIEAALHELEIETMQLWLPEHTHEFRLYQLGSTKVLRYCTGCDALWDLRRGHFVQLTPEQQAEEGAHKHGAID